MKQRIAVIGAGAAGLSAAWRLTEGGAAVTVFEAARGAGGLLRTVDVDGCAADVGVQLLASYYDETRALLAAAGMEQLLVRAPGRDALWRGGRAHEIAFGSSSSMIRSGALPLLLKARLGAVYLPFLLGSHDLSANAPVKAVRHDDESIASWGRREFGADFVELLAYPLLASYYGATPENTSAGFYHSLARAGLGVELFAVRGGMGALAGGLADALARAGAEIRTGIEVAAVECEAGGVRIAHGSGDEGFDAVVLAVPATRAARLAALPASSADWLGEVHTRNALAVALVLRRRLDHGWFGLSFPRTSTPGETIAAVCRQSGKQAGLRAQAGSDVLVVMPAPAKLPAFLRATSAEIAAAVIPALAAALPEVPALVSGSHVFRLDDAGVDFHAGHLRHLARFDPAALPARLELAGAYLVAPSVEGAVRSGAAAARRLLQKLES